MRIRCGALWAAVCSILLLSVSGAAARADVPANRRAFTIEDLYRVRYPSEISVSPDGTQILYRLVSRDLPAGTSNADVYRVGVKDASVRRMTTTEKVSESSPVWSPDGKQIAFIADRGDGSQIWLLPADGGEATALTELSTDISELRWSPDGRYIAFVSHVYPECGGNQECNRKKDERREAIPLKAHIADDLLYRHWTEWADGKVAHVLVVDVATGKVRDLTPGEREAPTFFGGAALEFSPDGRSLTYTRNPQPKSRHAWSINADLWEVPVEEGEDGATQPARDLTPDNPSFDGHPRYSPDGRYIAYIAYAIPDYEADLPRLTLLDRQTGKRRLLMPNFDDEVEEFVWAPGSDALVFTAAVKGQTPIFRINLEGGEPTRLATFAQIDELVLARGGSSAIVVRRAVGAPPEIWEIALKGKGEPRRITTHNRVLEQEVDIRPAESIWVPGADGRKIQVFIVKPHGFDPARKYPLIFNVHGGPQYQWADAFRGDWQVYPGAGYVVAFPNPTGSTGYGHDFTAAISRDWGGKVYEDLMKVCDALEKLPYVDPERVGAMGWSYGGYMMNWILGHTGRFKAVASMMGVYDLPSFYGGTEELWFPEWDLGGRPWDSGDYQRWNPARFAREMGEFKTPTLIVTGEKDFRIPYTQSLQLFTTLRRQGVPARLIVFPEAGHWPGWYEMALYYTAHLEWFERYLGGGGPSWSTTDFAEGAVFPAPSKEDP